MQMQIFLHAVRMVLSNLGPAMRISAALMLAQLVLVVVLGLDGVYSYSADATQTPQAGFFLFLAVQMFLGLWIVVAWHRYILQEEAPGAFLPRFDGAAIWRYVVASLIMVAIIIPLAMVVSVLAVLAVLPMLGSGNPGAGVALAGALIYLPIVYISYRISPILASAAIGPRLAVREAWYATGGSGGAILSISLLAFLFWIVLSIPGFVMEASFLTSIWGFLVQWATTLVAASTVTTIYGHYVEKRPLHG